MGESPPLGWSGLKISKGQNVKMTNSTKSPRSHHKKSTFGQLTHLKLGGREKARRLFLNGFVGGIMDPCVDQLVGHVRYVCAGAMPGGCFRCLGVFWVRVAHGLDTRFWDATGRGRPAITQITTRDKLSNFGCRVCFPTSIRLVIQKGHRRGSASGKK